MDGKLQLRKPENWQDFERLCKMLWGEIWNCPDTIKRNGRQGQAQAGVDIYCMSDDKIHYRGIQCKGKDEYTNSKLTEEEIDKEIEKAKNFKPTLDTFYFATTAVKDAHVEEYVRQKNVESLAHEGFSIDVFAWEDIVDLIESHRQTYNWYVNNCQYKDFTDVQITFNGKMQFTINPEYYKVKRIYKYKHAPNICDNPWEQGSLDAFREIRNISNMNFSMRPPVRRDYRWCKIPITIENIGATVIEDYKLSLVFNPQEVEDIDDNFHYLNNPLVDQAAIAQINNARDSSREVFQSNDYWNEIDFIPKKPILVQKDRATFRIKVIPKSHTTNSISIEWVLYSRNYSKNGTIKVDVAPLFEDKIEAIEVDDIPSVKRPEIEVKAKIVTE